MTRDQAIEALTEILVQEIYDHYGILYDSGWYPDRVFMERDIARQLEDAVDRILATA